MWSISKENKEWKFKFKATENVQTGWKSVIFVPCVVPFPVTVSCTPSLLSIAAWTGIHLHLQLLMRFEDATIQAQNLFCNPILLYDKQEFSLLNNCSTSFLPVNLWIASPVSRCFAFFSFFNKASQSQAMDQIFVLNQEDSAFA